MNAYTFSNLSDVEFEALVRDLLQKQLGLHLESFKKGRDKGIDLRYSKTSENQVIVQCKHYYTSGLSQLKSKLKSEELPKIIQLKPVRYILATSVGFTPDNKKELLAILAPYCKNTADIFGSEDLNNLLSQFPEVERLHYKLWMASTAVLERIVHSGVYNRSRWTESEINRRLEIYVHHEGYSTAQTILNENHVCIISGTPGIGKTTLAEILCVDYIRNGYQIIKVNANIRLCPETHFLSER